MIRDREIVRRIRKGDAKVFEALFRSSYIPLVYYAKRIIKDHDSSEEIVQDLFFRIWQNRENLKIESSLNGYLFRAVHNKCLHAITHNRVAENYARENNTEKIYAETPSDTLHFNELQGRVAAVLERLPERCGRIFCMNRFEGLKYREIADRLSLSVKTVEANMGKALKEFRKELQKQ